MEMRIYLDKVLFHLDVTGKQFIEVDNEQNCIPFSKMQQEEDYSCFDFDPVTKNIAEQNRSYGKEDVIEITLPNDLLENGYEEGSFYAARTNVILSQLFNFRLMDELALVEHLMEELREIEPVDLYGTRFLPDVSYCCLRQVDDPLNTIRFFHMENKGDHYLLWYDAETKNIGSSFVASSKVVPVEVKPMVALDRVGISEKYGMPLSEVPASDGELTCNRQLIERRLNGMLPEIKIGNQQYFVDLESNEFRAKNSAVKSFSFLDLHATTSSDEYYGYYDLTKNCLVDIAPHISEFPKPTIIMIIIPNEKWLDPIGFARKLGKADDAFLDRFHIVQKLDARLAPFRMSPHGIKIERRQNQELKKAKNKSKDKRKGKGL